MSNKRTITLTIELPEQPYVSKTEAAKAAEKGREPIAQALASSGGFARYKDSNGKDVRVSYNVMTA